MSVRDVVQAAAGALGGAAEATYVEDVFSTYLYTGNGSSQTIRNGILLGNGPANGTVLQLTCDDLTDSAPLSPHSISVNGTVTVSTSTKKYGTGSLQFSTGNYLTLTGNAGGFGTGDFTIEAWFYPTFLDSQVSTVFSSRTDNASPFNLNIFDDGTIRIGDQYTTSNTVSLNQWNHIAASRKNGVLRIFINGNIGSTNTVTTNYVSNGGCFIGNRNPGSNYPYLNGYLDDFRIIHGTALYTSNFTPPTAALDLDTLVEGQGGLVWIKDRTSAFNNVLYDTERGGIYRLVTNTTQASLDSTSAYGYVSSFNADGFSVNLGSGGAQYVNQTGDAYASWTFRKAPKFFDMVTYTGNGTTQNIIHNLGSVPGCVLVKRTDSAGGWFVYHRALDASSPETYNLLLQTTDVRSGASTYWGSTQPTDAVFTVADTANISGASFVAYLFAHDAGGFGDAGDQNVISCGSYTGNGSSTGPTISLGYEPQFLLIKNASDSYYGVADWVMFDVMRGIPMTGNDVALAANTSAAEANYSNWLNVTATGFDLTTTNAVVNQSGSTFIYIAIRRGPMKTPESGTEVFAPVATSGSTGTTHTIGFPLDLQMVNYRTGSFTYVSDRLRGIDSTTNETAYPFLKTSSTDPESTSIACTRNVNNTSFQTPSFFNGTTQIYWNFRRAPGFFDVVCYDGTGSTKTVAHNLGVQPELIITRQRTGTGRWATYAAPLGATHRLLLELSNAATQDSTYWADTEPTASVFTVGSSIYTNNSSGNPYVAYLFASVPGVSKVGSYTGNGTGQNIDCGFSTGARFVIIKAASTTGNWYVFDATRGVVAGNDPALLLNATIAEVTDTDYIDPYSSGFQLNSDVTLNESGTTYIYLAIA